MPRPVAVITGASSGLGAVFAERLAKDHDLSLVGGRRDRLEALAKRLGNGEAFKADLADRESLAKLEKRIAAEPRLALVVNNAGFAGYRPFLEIDPAVADELIEVHVRASVRLTRAALPGMVQRRGRAGVNAAPPPPLPRRPAPPPP